MMNREPLIWRMVARVVCTAPVRAWLVRRATGTPYATIGPATDPYMRRGWIFNPYPGHGNYRAGIPFLPSVRVHQISRPDSAAHPHDHPLRSRTIILSGGYLESRHLSPRKLWRVRGDTYTLRPEVDFHHIEATGSIGATTLFITWPPVGTPAWGFLVDGVRILHEDYKRLYGRFTDHDQSND